MRRLWVGMLLFGLSIPAMAVKPVNVREFEEVMETCKGFSDGGLARKIDGMELTERLSLARFESLYASLPGKRSKQSLTQLADVASFLGSPAMDVDAKAAPHLSEQREILLQVVSYAREMFPKLPNFFASRDVLRFMELKPLGPHGEDSMRLYDRLHPIGTSKDIVLYRDGHEVVDTGATKKKKQDESDTQGLTTHGLFGPVLGVVLVDAIHGDLHWGHWEQGKSGPLAVFQFSVPREKSHYEVTFCCFTLFSGRQENFKKYSAYHGEMAVDPASGAILRLSILSDMEALDPVRKSQIVVNYDHVEIGGNSYICPTRSISMLVAYKEGSSVQETTLNDTQYSDYHRFGTESRIITDLPEDPH